MKTVIAAQPGWCLLTPINGPAPERKCVSLHSEPIVAWLVEPGDVAGASSFVDVHPVTADWTANDRQTDCGPPMMLQRPDGSVFEPGHTDYGPIEDEADRLEICARFQEHAERLAVLEAKAAQ